MRIVSDRSDEHHSELRSSSPNLFQFEAYQEFLRSGIPSRNAVDATTARADVGDHSVLATNILEKPNDATLDMVWATVWWRRVAYFATLIATALIAFWPLLPDISLPSALEPLFTPTRPVEVSKNIIVVIGDVLRPVINFGIDFAASFLPSFATAWLAPYKSTPWSLVCLALLLVAVMICSAWIDRRIHDRALAAWNRKWGEQRYKWLKAVSGRRLMAYGGAGASAGMGLQQFIDSYLSVRNIRFSPLLPGGEESILYLKELYLKAQISFFIGAGIFAALMIVAFLNCFWTLRWMFFAKGMQQEVSGPALRVAEFLGKSSYLTMCYGILAKSIVPVLFALTLIVACFLGFNRFGFSVISMGGWDCPLHDASVPLKEIGVPRHLIFNFSNGCFESNIELESDANYEIVVENVTQPKPTSMMHLALPLRRILDQPWFVPIARIGQSSIGDIPLDQSVNKISPRQTGRLFVFINDAVIGVPKLWDAFYRFNRGVGKIAVTRLQQPAK